MMRPDSQRTILLIDDEPASVRLIVAMAARIGWRVTAVAEPGEIVQALSRREIARLDAILLNRWEPGPGSDLAVAQLRERFPAVPLLMLVARDAVGLAVEAMRAGAGDYLLKPLTPGVLLAALEGTAAAGSTKAQGELRPMAEKLPGETRLDALVGTGNAFRLAVAAAEKAARTRASVLIEGEAGTGKASLARAIHAGGPRREAPFVAVDCALVAANLIESELFGHERGAFPGAFDHSLGRFGEAEGGTLYLQNVDRLSPEMQARLLNAVEHGEVRPIGARACRAVDVRVISACRHPLHDDVAAGRFREDLFYRINLVQIGMPPLRAALGDLPALADRLLARIAGIPGMPAIRIAPAALELLESYGWPGNVRQLQTVLFRAALACATDRLEATDFPTIARAAKAPTPMRSAAPATGVASPGPAEVALFEASGHVRPLEEIEADIIRLAIGHYRGRMTEVARRLGIGRSTLYRKLGELGIENAA